MSSKNLLTTHYLHELARDPDFEGRSALCDYKLGLDDEPRVTTLSSATASDVTCSDCLAYMEDA